MIKIILVISLAAALTAFHIWIDSKIKKKKKGDEDD